ncbi:MAG: hypothetical protein ACHBN1_10655 [Heteroscytonema crispum UTEX LB 1556]
MRGLKNKAKKPIPPTRIKNVGNDKGYTGYQSTLLALQGRDRDRV